MSRLNITPDQVRLIAEGVRAARQVIVGAAAFVAPDRLDEVLASADKDIFAKLAAVVTEHGLGDPAEVERLVRVRIALIESLEVTEAIGNT